MSVNQAELVKIIYDSVFSRMVKPIQNSEKQEVLLSLEFPGQQLDESQYQNPWSPENPDGAQFSTEMFSELIDAIPLVSPTYIDSGITIEEMYDFILGASALPLAEDSGGTNPINRLLSRAQNLFDNTTMARAFHPALTYHPSYATPFNWADPKATQNWTTISINTEKEKPKPSSPFLKLEKLEKSPSLKEGLWKISPNQLSQLDQIRSEIPVKPVESLTVVKPVTLQVVDPMALRTIRNINLSNASQKQSARIQELSSTANRIHSSIHPQLSRVQLQPRKPMFARLPVSTLKPAVIKPIDNSTKGLEISFRCCRVSCKRPWVMQSLFSLGGWMLPGQSPGSFSNGSLNNNEGIFPVIPMSFLAIRDLKIRAQWSEADRKIANQASSSEHAVGFGPFSLSGYTAETNQAYQSTFDGITISSPGLQILGWINVATPFMPPKPG